MNKHEGDTVKMLNKLMQTCSITYKVIFIVFLLILGHGSFVDAEGVRGHGDVNDVIVTVDGDPVTRGDILRRIRIAKGDIDPSKMAPGKWKEIFQTATKSEIIDKLFLKAARSENLEIEPEALETYINKTREKHGQDRFEKALGIQGATEQEFKEAVREKMLIEEYRSRLVKIISIENEEVKKYYEDNKDTLGRPDRAHLEMLVVDKSDDADALFKRIKKGDDFDKIAREDDNNEKSSIERIRRWTDYSTLPEERQAQLKEGKTGDILEPLLINDTYYIMKILEKRPAGIAGLDEVGDRIREVLKRKKETTTILSWYESRVRDHKIEYVKE
ncbi:MAG: peptidyl-prolyl cis-trans isomerase [Nitrospiraceae bacterium]|nr:MAG: peptidyl-prolyl cis-trans isomerase [Nitrospiraceae bacterium]